MRMLVEMKEVSKVYPMGAVAVCALNRVSLLIQAGEFVAIVGPSGSGKTTLVDIMGCLSRPTSGDYFLSGQPVQGLEDAELARVRNKKIGFIFQTFHLMGRYTAAENVALPLFYSGLSKEARLAMAEEAMGLVGLADRLGHRPNQLSGGQQQRVAIARALVNNPQMILADEPTGNLDSKSGREIIDILIQLNRNGHTIVLITHDLALASLAHRTLSLKDGQVVSDR